MLDTEWQGKFCKQDRTAWLPAGKLLKDAEPQTSLHGWKTPIPTTYSFILAQLREH